MKENGLLIVHLRHANLSAFSLTGQAHLEPMNLENKQCGFFTAITEKTGNNLLILEILQDIKDGRWARKISELRKMEGESYKGFKKKLPAFMISAATQSGGHGRKDLGQHTGLLQIDIDNLTGMQHAQDVKKRLADDPHVLACWISPSGIGLKGIVAIPASHDMHKACFKVAEAYFQNTLGHNIDASCCDAGRLCFVSHDPDLILKDEAKAFYPIRGKQKDSINPGNEVNSSQSLHSSSSVLCPTFYITNPWRDYPCLEKFYQKLVVEPLGNVQPGLRNRALVDRVPVLYSAIAPHLVLLFAERFYQQNSFKFHDPLEQHMKEAEALLDGIEASYARQRLTPEESAIYSLLEKEANTAFRICHALSHVQDEACPPPFFFLSAEQLGFRLGKLTMEAHRILIKLCHLGVIEVSQKGTRRTKRHLAIATRYQWLLPTKKLI
jgi:hypothetical protein